MRKVKTFIFALLFINAVVSGFFPIIMTCVNLNVFFSSSQMASLLTSTLYLNMSVLS